MRRSAGEAPLTCGEAIRDEAADLRQFFLWRTERTLGSPTRFCVGGTGPLTKREAEVAALIAEGLSNRALAEKLVISHRTVDGHVERILAKVEFTSRIRVAT